MPTDPDIKFQLTVGGYTVPIEQFRVVGGAFGTVGHLTAVTSETVLAQQNVDLFSLTSKSPGFVEVDLAVTMAITPPNPSGGYDNSQPSRSTTRIFGGEYVKTEFSLDDDKVTIHARDWAGVLVDQKRILTKIGNAAQKILAPLAPGRVTVAGISNENQKISAVVTAICTEFGFNPVINLSSDGRNPTIGTLYGSADQSFITIPQSLWTILCQLARDTGYDVYVTPTKDLVFGEPGAGLSTLGVVFNVAPTDGQMPCHSAKIEHHPRRNSTFRVLVMSYDPSKGQATIGRATYIASNFAGARGINPGLQVGQAAVSIDAALVALSQAGGKVSNVTIPLYSFHVDGLSADQATLRAQTICTDIAKRELIFSATVEGLPSILPTQKVTLTGDVKANFTSQPFYVATFEHAFTMPKPGSHSHHDAGWVTKFTCLNIPIEALAKAGDEG